MPHIIRLPGLDPFDYDLLTDEQRPYVDELLADYVEHAKRNPLYRFEPFTRRGDTGRERLLEASGPELESLAKMALAAPSTGTGAQVGFLGAGRVKEKMAIAGNRSGKTEIGVVDDLIQLCDREDPRDLLIDTMHRRATLAKGSALFCILPGGARQGHCGFLERVRAYELRHQIPGVAPGQVILVPRVVRQNLETPEKLGATILSAIRDGARDAGVDSWPKLQRWMNGGKQRIFIVALEPPSDALSGREHLFLANAAAWLGRWVAAPARQIFVLVACLRHAGGEGEGERVRRIVDEFVADFSAPVDWPPTIVPLPELASITREDVERWWTHEAVKPVRNPRLKAKLDQLFAERAHWAMDDLRDRLAASF